MESFNSTTLIGFTFDYDLNYTDSIDYDMVKLCVARKELEQIITAVQTTVFFVVFSGIIGNGLVIATFIRYHHLHLRWMTDVFLFYLALSDMLLLLTFPLQMGEMLGRWIFGQVPCKLNRGMYAINTYGGLLLLACISVDHYFVVVRTRAVRKSNSLMWFYSKLFAFGITFISVVLSVPDLYFSSVERSGVDSDVHLCGMEVWGDDVGKWKLWTLMPKIAGLCIPFMVIVVCYGAIVRILIRAGEYWRRQKTLCLMALLFVLLLLFQLPYNVVFLIKIFTPTPQNCEDWTKFYLQDIITRDLVYVRCCLNPVLYAIVGIRFRNYPTLSGC